jgi:hypothetical protein
MGGSAPGQAILGAGRLSLLVLDLLHRTMHLSGVFVAPVV